MSVGGMAHPWWGVDFGPYLMASKGVASMSGGGGGKPKVSSSLNHGLLQFRLNMPPPTECANLAY